MNPVPAQIACDEDSFVGKPDERIADGVAWTPSRDLDPALALDYQASVDEEVGQDQFEVVGMTPEVAVLVESFGGGLVAGFHSCGEGVDRSVDLGLPGGDVLRSVFGDLLHRGAGGDDRYVGKDLVAPGVILMPMAVDCEIDPVPGQFLCGLAQFGGGAARST